MYLHVGTLYTGNLVTSRYLFGEQASGIELTSSRVQPLYICIAITRYRVLVWSRIVQVNEWIICPEGLGLLSNLHVGGRLVSIGKDKGNIC
jgi:hypothetical protein